MKNAKGSPALIDRIEYVVGHPEAECPGAMFSVEEREILKTIHEFEQMRYGEDGGGHRRR